MTFQSMPIAIRIKKSLGQHFLRDSALAGQIANLLTNKSLLGTVIEVGRIYGAFNRPIIQKGKIIGTKKQAYTFENFHKLMDE